MAAAGREAEEAPAGCGERAARTGAARVRTREDPDTKAAPRAAAREEEGERGWVGEGPPAPPAAQPPADSGLSISMWNFRM